jgi:hypothetical protein
MCKAETTAQCRKKKIWLKTDHKYKRHKTQEKSMEY